MAKATPSSLRGKLTPQEVRATIHKLCEENDYDPFKELIILATEKQEITVAGKTLTVPVCDVDQRILIAKELAQYMAPKLKSIEVEGQIDAVFTFKIKHFDSTGNEMSGPVAEAEIVDKEVNRITDQAKRLLSEPLETEIVED